MGTRGSIDSRQPRELWVVSDVQKLRGAEASLLPLGVNFFVFVSLVISRKLHRHSVSEPGRLLLGEHPMRAGLLQCVTFGQPVRWLW